MKLSRTVTYALKATLQLARNADGPPIPCSRLASQGAMPERFLLQILRSLVTHGILKSTRGVDGGYVLLHHPASVSMLDVIEAIEGPLVHEVVFGEGLMDSTRDQLVSVMESVNTTVRDRLAAVKLADLVAEDNQVAKATQTVDAAINSADPTCQPTSGNATVTPRVDTPNDATGPVPAPIIAPNPNAVGSVNSVQSVNSDR